MGHAQCRRVASAKALAPGTPRPRTAPDRRGHRYRRRRSSSFDDGPKGSSANRTIFFFFMPPRRCRRRRSCSTPMSNAVLRSAWNRRFRWYVKKMRLVDARAKATSPMHLPRSIAAGKQAACPSFSTTTPTTRCPGASYSTSVPGTVSSIITIVMYET
jgi:hypothetical protein